MRKNRAGGKIPGFKKSYQKTASAYFHGTKICKKGQKPQVSAQKPVNLVIFIRQIQWAGVFSFKIKKMPRKPGRPPVPWCRISVKK